MYLYFIYIYYVNVKCLGLIIYYTSSKCLRFHLNLLVFINVISKWIITVDTDGVGYSIVFHLYLSCNKHVFLSAHKHSHALFFCWIHAAVETFSIAFFFTFTKMTVKVVLWRRCKTFYYLVILLNKVPWVRKSDFEKNGVCVWINL